jgi:hypothetical protein
MWHSDTTCTAKAYEDVTVPAGTFKAFRIECEDRYTFEEIKGVTRSTRWYAPAVRDIVKQTGEEDRWWDFELTAYQLAK